MLGCCRVGCSQVARRVFFFSPLQVIPPLPRTFISEGIMTPKFFQPQQLFELGKCQRENDVVFIRVQHVKVEICWLCVAYLHLLTGRKMKLLQ
ncbi:Uncharacterized protein APZ42_019686 [Daphnia magna]|uniref:Uncharacterized protein n=1 Tax=Daphnia magna TaxID=35525 RepID=A0A164YBQ9_9CRUS|nr:Uncharacterized protein APZ42_019686 [Daphnia magna]